MSGLVSILSRAVQQIADAAPSEGAGSAEALQGIARRALSDVAAAGFVLPSARPSAPRIQREFSCDGKIGYGSIAKAKNIIGDMVSKGRAERGEMTAYFCRHCHSFHVGHAVGKRALRGVPA